MCAEGKMALMILVATILINVADICSGGITSRYVRLEEKSKDMPLNSDVFAIPPGYNAPQQVDFFN